MQPRSIQRLYSSSFSRIQCQNLSPTQEKIFLMSRQKKFSLQTLLRIIPHFSLLHIQSIFFFISMSLPPPGTPNFFSPAERNKYSLYQSHQYYLLLSHSIHSTLLPELKYYMKKKQLHANNRYSFLMLNQDLTYGNFLNISYNVESGMMSMTILYSVTFKSFRYIKPWSFGKEWFAESCRSSKW